MMDNWLQLGSSLVYEKEVLPVGKLVRWVGDSRAVQHATINRPFLDRLVSNFKKFKEMGIRVPLFKTHNEDPSNTRGYIEDVSVKPNSKGEDSLFVKASFNDENAVKLAMDNDVSVLIPPKFVDGRGNSYDWPLRHVAITATPVVPGLEPWGEPIVLAFSDNSGVTIVDDGKGGIDVDKILASLASKLSLSFGDSDTADQKLEKVLAAIETMKTDNITLSSQLPEETVVMNFPPVLLKQFKNVRAAKIDQLVEKRTISASLAADWRTQYCGDAAVQLDLSLDSDETQFDRDVALAERMAKDRPISIGPARQTLKMSSTEDGASNPLVADAKRRAEQHKQRTA